jgi:hypothetical protein
MTNDPAAPVDRAAPELPDRPDRPDGPELAATRWTDVDPIAEALVNAGTAVWEWDLVTDELHGAVRAERMLGYAPHEFARTQRDWDAFIHPDDLAVNEVAYQAHARGETPSHECAYRARARDGRWCWLLERGRIIERAPDGTPVRMVGTLSDLGAQRETELVKAEWNGRLGEVADSVPGVLFQMEQTPERKRFTFVSDRCEDVLRLPAALLIQDVQAFESRRLLDGDTAASLDGIDPSRSAGPWVSEYPFLRGDGAVRWIRITSTAQATAQRVRWNGYMEDVTERREFDALRQQAAEATAANRAKTEFLSRMSHELRTPLNAVLGFAQLLEMDTREPLSDAQRQRVARIREAGDHLVDMIGDLLDYARIESGQLALDIAPVTVRAVAVECCEMLAPEADRHAVRLVIEPTRDPDDLVALADRTRLRQVLLNLLSNAVKYNRRGGQVELRLERAGSRALVHIADTGMGIAAAELDGLFQPFNRLGHARSGIEGTGIGLAVSRGLAEMMGGTIEVSSVAGVGSTFTLALRLADASPGSIAPS